MKSRTVPLDFADVQGIVRFGYKHMTEACYFLLRIKDLVAARAWLLAAPITNAAEQTPPPPVALQVAFTSPGLAALHVPAAVIAGFSNEFITGMAEDESRSRRLGDVGTNAPSTWRWGAGAGVPHLIIMAFAQAGGLAAYTSGLTDRIWDEAFEVVTCLNTSDLGGIEPFGFTDGVSQPVPDWERTRDATGFQYTYGNLVALGEILLGYRNEYHRYTDRPLVESAGAARNLFCAEDDPSKRDVGRNGTYVVMRDLRQDVRAFRQFVDDRAAANMLAPDELAAAMVGRTRSGASLLPPQSRSISGVGTTVDEVRLNGFTYDGDPDGEQCPFGAHVRRANPRNADFPRRVTGVVAQLAALLGFGGRGFRDDVVSSVRFHRLLRRGREYGPALPPAATRTPAPPDDAERGLRFIALNANILRQFEFLQNAWMRNTKFDGMTGESDPLLGNRTPIPGCPLTDAFTMPRAGGVRRRISGVPQFVTVRGGAYFFLPGLRALRYLAEVGA
ncbi:MAG: peroxidase [Candidatus Velthaea sp.]